MALTVRRADRVVSFGNVNSTPIQRSSMVKIKLYNPGIRTDAGKPIPDWAKTGLWVLNLEPFAISVSTSWKDGPGASIAGKINDLMNSSILKLLGGPQMWQPITTDSWSQRVVDKGSPMSTKVKFRVYYEPNKNERLTTDADYISIIRFFTRAVTPPNQYSLWNGITGAIAGALRNAKQTGQDIATASEVEDENGDKHTDVEKAIKYTLAAIPARAGLDEPGQNGDSAVRGQYTFTLSTEKFGCESLDWILKNFTWTPSQQMVIHWQTKMPCPLWIDFELDFETNICPSNAYVSRFFSKIDTIEAKKKPAN